MFLLIRKSWKRSETDTPKLRSAYQTKKKKKNRKSFSVPLLTFLNAKLKVKLFGAVILQLE